MFEEGTKHFPLEGSQRAAGIGIDADRLGRARRGRLAEQVPLECEVRTKRDPRFRRVL
jgi:hypothetical protein